MGTRNLTMVCQNNEYKVAQYGQWDGYPEGLGSDILKFLKNENLDIFKEMVNNVEFMTSEEMKIFNEQTDEKLRKNANYVWQDEFPWFSRDCGAEILYHILKGRVNKLVSRLSFAADSLFCEWAYVIDLDNNRFEVYEGFNEEPLTKDDRFYFLEDKVENNGYHPVRLVKSYSLDDLPEENTFIEECDLSDEDDS